MKRSLEISTQKPASLTWNQKNLDYEIETSFELQFQGLQASLEIKRTSITRLKHDPGQLESLGLYTWNQKNLDYEIETYNARFCVLNRSNSAWNQKNLDYEIETLILEVLITLLPISLKSKEPRLRDWNFARHPT